MIVLVVPYLGILKFLIILVSIINKELPLYVVIIFINFV